MFGFQMRRETPTDLQSDFSTENSRVQLSVKNFQLEKGKQDDVMSGIVNYFLLGIVNKKYL
jgi:hypothetical protein